MQMKTGVPLNDDPGLEREADRMGDAALDTVGQARAVNKLGEERLLAIQRAATDTIQAMLVKVVTKPTAIGMPRVISEVHFEGRVPTTAGSGQGDHTVAEALMELRLEKFCVGKTHLQVAHSIHGLLVHLDQEVSTKYLQSGKFIPLNIDALAGDIKTYTFMAEKGAEGEDLNNALDHLLTNYLRLWNKREGSAYPKGAGLTSGGGDEKEGKKGIKGVMEGMDEESGLDDSPEWKLKLARSLTQLIDFKAGKDLVRAGKNVAHALDILFEMFPESEEYYNDVATLAVEIYSGAEGLNREQEEYLDEVVFELLRGKDEDYDMLPESAATGEEGGMMDESEEQESSHN